MNEARVHIVDDDAAVCDSLCLLCETAGLSARCYPNPEAFLAGLTDTCRGCIVLDVNMPRMSGIELHEELRRRGLPVPVVYLTAYGDIPLTVRAMKLGAADFFTKPIDGAAFIGRIQALLAASAQADSSSQERAEERVALLTAREREVMRLALGGYTSKEIGRQLGISYRTVEIHRSRMMKKTQCANLMALARLDDELKASRSGGSDSEDTWSAASD